MKWLYCHIKANDSKKIQDVESYRSFLQAKQKHSAVASAINDLGVHGLARCSGHGLDGFKRYVVLSIVERNIIKKYLEQFSGDGVVD